MMRRTVRKLSVAAFAAVTLGMPLAGHGMMLMPPPDLQTEGALVLVDQGCGPGWWRGPWGHCRNTPFSGNMPGGGYGTNIGESYWGNYTGNGCAPGWWRGPWGHCRDTPYHGRLPDGSWQ